jgi:hypothetical protein
LVSSVLLLIGSKDIDELAGESVSMRWYVAMIIRRPGARRKGFLSGLEPVADIECVIDVGSGMDWGVVYAVAQTYRLPYP